MRSVLSIFVSSFLAVVPALMPAGAATASASFSVSVTVVDTCLIAPSQISPTSISVGGYFETSFNASSAVSVNCLHSTPYTLALRSELAQNPTTASLRVVGAGWEMVGSTLGPGRERTGNCNHISDTEMMNAPGDFVSALSPIAQIPAGQFAAAGAYEDSVTVTVTY